MSEESTPVVNEDLPPAAEGPQPPASVGAVLAAAREQAGMSVDQVAAKLRFSVRQIRALEEGDAAVLPDPTFVRGFIRSYAKFLGLDAEPLISMYATQAPSIAEQSISLHSENIRISGLERQNWLPYLLAVLLLLIALAAWLMLTEPQSAPAEAVQPAAEEVVVAPEVESVPAMQPVLEAVPAQPEPALPAEVPAAVPAASPAATVTPSTLEASPPAVVTPSAPAAAAVVAAPVPGGAKLEMTYSQEVWLSVLDRDGKEIFNKTKPANSKDMVEGLPPLQLVIGNAAGVSLSYKGKPVDLAPHTKANVARLTLE